MGAMCQLPTVSAEPESENIIQQHNSSLYLCLSVSPQQSTKASINGTFELVLELLLRLPAALDTTLCPHQVRVVSIDIIVLRHGISFAKIIVCSPGPSQHPFPSYRMKKCIFQ